MDEATILYEAYARRNPIYENLRKGRCFLAEIRKPLLQRTLKFNVDSLWVEDGATCSIAGVYRNIAGVRLAGFVEEARAPMVLVAETLAVC